MLEGTQVSHPAETFDILSHRRIIENCSRIRCITELCGGTDEVLGVLGAGDQANDRGFQNDAFQIFNG